MIEIQATGDGGPTLPALPPLHALRAFHAAARFGRFKDAAEALGLSESAISHQIKKLEAYLGTRLFERDGRTLVLSAHGRHYYERIDPAFSQIRQATEAMTRPSGQVALTLTKSLASLWLIPRLGQLERAVPEITLQLVATSRLVDLAREQIDLGIRYGCAPWPGVEAEHLFHEEAFPVCRPGYMTTPASADIAASLAPYRLIVYMADEWHEWVSARGQTLPDGMPTLKIDSHQDGMEAAAEGLGLAIGCRPLIDRYLEDGRLVAPFGACHRSGCAYSLIRPAGRELTLAAKKVARWIRETARHQTGPLG